MVTYRDVSVMVLPVISPVLCYRVWGMVRVCRVLDWETGHVCQKLQTLGFFACPRCGYRTAFDQESLVEVESEILVGVSCRPSRVVLTYVPISMGYVRCLVLTSCVLVEKDFGSCGALLMKVSGV